MQLLGRNDHGNISVVCDELEDSKLIEEHGKRIHPGRPEIFYKITLPGINYLIENSPNPTEFWRSLTCLIYHKYKSVHWNTILKILNVYLRRYLRYYSNRGYYLFQLDSFNNACEQWFEKTIVNNSKLSVAQKILEVLATNPGITLDQIAKFSREKLKTIESLIRIYTMVPLKPVLVDINGNSDGVWYDAVELQIHKAITVSESQGVKTFSLSLYGVLMVLYIVRKMDMKSLPQGLFNKIGVEEYFDVIAKNYKSKIPLILGKWDILKSHLREISYLNFDVITDRSTRDRFFQASLLDDGNREFYLGMKSITIVSRKQLHELQTAGFNIIFNFSPTVGCKIRPKSGIDRTEVFNRIKLAFNLIIYIISMAEPRAYDSQSFLSLYSGEEHLGPEIAREISSLFELENLEKNLSLEVAFIYYLNLRREFRSTPYAEALNKDLVTSNKVFYPSNAKPD